MDHAEKKMMSYFTYILYSTKRELYRFYYHPESWNLLWFVSVPQRLSEIEKEVSVIARACYQLARSGSGGETGNSQEQHSQAGGWGATRQGHWLCFQPEPSHGLALRAEDSAGRWRSGLWQEGGSWPACPWRVYETPGLSFLPLFCSLDDMMDSSTLPQSSPAHHKAMMLCNAAMAKTLWEYDSEWTFPPHKSFTSINYFIPELKICLVLSPELLSRTGESLGMPTTAIKYRNILGEKKTNIASRNPELLVLL